MKRPSNNAIVSSRRGQTLIIAIMVMFILAVIAAVFIALVARNLFRSTRYSNVDAVAQIAEAGVRYADKMLTTSEDGADWRPAPDNLGSTSCGNPWDGTTPTADTSTDPTTGNPVWQSARDKNPDFKWTRPYWPTELYVGAATADLGYAGPTGGYSKFDTGGGRFLLRLSYIPNPKDGLSKYIKIESIGRWGVIDNNDPTTWKPHGDVLMRREITAYKPIGITDYVRFMTNKDNRSVDLPLGCPGFDMRWGRTSASNYSWRVSPIRANGNLVWYGNAPINLFLRGLNAGGTQLAPVDAVEVAGDIRTESGAQVKLTRLGLDGTVTNTVDLLSSVDPNFTTASGFYRDGSDSVDIDQAARGVKRIEAPQVDQLDPTGTTARYLLLTRYSGQRIIAGGRRVNLGDYGWGRGVYISNMRDKQDESETLIGGYTLRSDWLKPNNPMSTYWKGPYYIPPAVVINLRPNDYETVTESNGSSTHKQYYFTVTRTDTLNNGNKFVWRDAFGNAKPEWGGTIRLPYPDPNHIRVLKDGTTTKYLDGNGVIYAEGNIRIRGMLPPGMQLTVVSNQNIYIDGNLLKYRDGNATIPAGDPYRASHEVDPVTNESRDTNTCGLALLARQNICVNTTQFFTPLNSISAENVGSDAQNGQPPFHITVNNSPDTQLKCAFDFGPYESEAGNAPIDWVLYLRHAGDFGPTYVNAWLNANSTLTDWGLLWLNPGVTALPTHVYGVGDPRFNPAGWGTGSAFVGDSFALATALNATLFTDPGSMNLLRIGLDQTSYTRNNYLMGGLAVQPMDIRIEAVLYAQEGSFFVIPGNWFNPDPTDTRAAYAATSKRPEGVKGNFPFFGEPLDIRVIVDGAVSENIPAAIGDVNEWMSKWGRIPDKYGSSSTDTAHPGEGLTFLYDDHAGWPLSDVRTGARTPIRLDKFNRALPIAPRLPVSPSLIYFGDVM